MTYDYTTTPETTTSPFMVVLYILLAIVVIAAQWRIFTKAGRPGWACLIPFYNLWVEYDIICGSGAKMFFLLIPLFNIYWEIKTMIKLAHAYGRSTGFGIGLLFLPAIFLCILGFGGAQYEGPQRM